MIAFLAGVMAAFFALMKQITNSNTFIAWIKVCIAVSAIQILIVDTILMILFGLFFSKAS
jgi:uncharacterized membrane protein